VLCRNCNNGRGLFGDDPATLRAAADYLDKWTEWWSSNLLGEED
jgi:hypothetical protein